ncbi:glycosyltransferase family 25 protein [Pectobacterium carotovorum]|uniref:hypothetical protein n=1 Tax=Pectobacterium carotovorum TaxID=554 RepID=UPI0010FF2442|nr:hypothetical protein [Pectobacterium carotovorum]KAA3669069.1 hypothetical protein FEV48_03395 [Pectobacterium carotovorum subsp. carotovorum]
MEHNGVTDLFVGIINLKHREDRRNESLTELSSSSILVGNDVFFDAVYVENFGALGASISHANVLAKYLSTSTAPYAMILEDDFEIADKENFLLEIGAILEKDQCWDVFLLSHNLAVAIETTAISDCYRVVNSQTASGYIVKREFAPELIKVFFDSVVNLNKFSNYELDLRKQLSHFYCLDILWKKLQTDNRFVAKIPALIKQRSSYSDIEKINVDYGV